MALEIICVVPIYPQYSGVLETCLALRYWFFEVLGSESVKLLPKDFIVFAYFVKKCAASRWTYASQSCYKQKIFSEKNWHDKD